jgi:Mitochondrial ribosomal protein MRP-S35
MAQVTRSGVINLLRANFVAWRSAASCRYYSKDELSGSKVTENVSASNPTEQVTEAGDQARAPMSGLEKTFDMFHRVELASSGDQKLSSESNASSESRLKSVSFASLLRRSKLMHIGDPEGRVVVGTIMETLNDDLYIDFGGKFDCVCKRPRTRAEYVLCDLYIC